MSGPYYPIITIDPDWVQAEEWMGSKNKRWVSLPEDKERWLFKYARVNAGVPTGEHWAEKVAAEVAELLGLRHALVDLATLEGRPGSLSRRFAELSYPGTALVHGNVLLKGHVLGYDLQKKFRQSDHTLGNILRVFDHIIANDEQRMRALGEFMGYLVLDALVLNTDRHHENWALVSHASVFGIADHKLAPHLRSRILPGSGVDLGSGQGMGARSRERAALRDESARSHLPAEQGSQGPASLRGGAPGPAG